MWTYDRKLEYPVKICRPNAALAKIIISQLGGPDGELGAATRYLSQRYVMPDRRIIGMLTDIGTSVSVLFHLHIGDRAFDTVNRHFSGRIFR